MDQMDQVVAPTRIRVATGAALAPRTAPVAKAGEPAKSNTPPAVAPKDRSVETLRGVAILLVVAFHAIDRNAPAFWEHFAFSLNYIRMPLFTVISGFVYALRPVQAGRAWTFLQGKARRVLLPFLSVATLQFVMQAVVSGRQSPPFLHDIWRIFIFSYEHFWFLQSIAIVFVVVTWLELRGCLNDLRSWVVWLSIAVLLTLVIPRHPVVPIDGAVYLLPYFILGCGLNRFAVDLARVPVVAAAVVLAVGGLALQQLVRYGHVDIPIGTRSLLAIAVGMSATLLCFRFRISLPVLGRVGTHAYPIYLLHAFGIALGVRLAGIAAIGERTDACVIIKFAVGLAFALAAEAVLMRLALTRRLFFGLRD